MKYLIVVFVAVLFAFPQQSLANESEAKSNIQAGKTLAFDRKKGNCLACHMIDDGKLAGTVAPPLTGMKSRFPDRAVLRAQIWDASVKNKYSVMPPFGRHAILSDKEIDLIVDYVHSL